MDVFLPVAFILVATVVLITATLGTPPPRISLATPDGPRFFHGREGRRHAMEWGGRRFRIYTRTAMGDIYACIEVPLREQPERTLVLGAVEEFGFQSVTITDATLSYVGSDRWRLLHDPLGQNPALDDGPHPEGDGRRVHIRFRDGHLLLGFRQVDDDRLPGILSAMNALAGAIEDEQLREWRELGEAFDLDFGFGHASGDIEGCAVQVTDRVLIHHGLELPANFQLAHKDHLDGEGLGDPVVDLLLQAVEPGDFRVDHDAVEPLLKALHGHPGSVLDATTLTLIPGDAGLRDALACGLALVRALR